MVLWEITLATAYFLGLKRTYKLALKIQRRVTGPKHPKIRQFLQRRTRSAFDIALKVHRNIQQRDIEVGRNLGNWILRWLDRIKPSANIRGSPQGTPYSNRNANTSTATKQAPNHPQKNNNGFQRFSTISFDKNSNRHLFSVSRYVWQKPLNPVGSATQYRRLCINGPEVLRPSCGRAGFGGVMRKDIALWIRQS